MPWTTISDATLEVGKALRALTMRNLRDNITALANGDTGAPKVQTLAIQDSAVATAKIAASAVTSAKMATGSVLTATIGALQVTSAKLATGTGERDWVLARTADAGVGTIGSYAFLAGASGTAFVAGTAYSGLLYGGVRTTPAAGVSGSAGGTWMAMGAIPAASGQSPFTVFLRIA